ncbi:nitrile hydratase accessory protein [Sulfitobacter mediterraneus]|jgi:nitrile hydratase accessory protein|uniref:nitrile hydratase accessory protein n=1 Tax=Sulfitobacter mediterraneus TaxID=83219 RepID=UPI001934736D|nr:nitrile hydratase accessory protein [Sulfitobacter mediterraneus]MBM1634158.1 nitrile hydratase accessory protein [Sulfitobacter mediterraneus]MBM1641327.1 nitrile hydratase accessory protein [Sulfitobacter mediterraneus]MBM1646023.1 nitrile hydratase accessory protein [Sulfitobacter mediterraneus]MBM1649446.1 nitrile hydratase accessory protein [Sulfitobacter mediterraneus]MBM1654091.1 nitrile hydratase accessory protein [Sulfitobacter mediterraneus]
MSAPEPAFEAPWHAQVFALTVHLNEAGHFAWADWAERFGATLARHGLDKELNGGEDYFTAWLETLEGYLAEIGMAAPADVADLRNAWEAAYLSTPHGAPVHLAD